MAVLQRENWPGPAVYIGSAWQLHKSACGGAREAVCELWSHPLGWELRLVTDGGVLRHSQVCHSNDEVIETHEQWKAAMVDSGWR